MNNIISYISDKIENTQDNWIKKFTYDEILTVVKINRDKHKSIDDIKYAYEEREQLKGQLVERGNEAYNSLKLSYNDKGFDNLILSGLDTNFDNELSEIEKEY